MSSQATVPAENAASNTAFQRGSSSSNVGCVHPDIVFSRQSSLRPLPTHTTVPTSNKETPLEASKGNGKGTPAMMPMVRMGSGPSLGRPAGNTLVPTRARNLPAMWMLNLLVCSGWKVYYDQRLQDYVYTTPQGQLLHPFERVVEFLAPAYNSRHNGRQLFAAGTPGAGTSGTGGDRSIAIHNTVAGSGTDPVRATNCHRASTSTGRDNRKIMSAHSVANGSGAGPNNRPSSGVNTDVVVRHLNSVLAMPCSNGTDASANGCSRKRTPRGNRSAGSRTPRQRVSNKKSTEVDAIKPIIVVNYSGSTKSGPNLEVHRSNVKIATVENNSRKKKDGSGSAAQGNARRQRHRCFLIARSNSTKVSSVSTSLPKTNYTILSWLISAGVLTESEIVMYVPRDDIGHVNYGQVTRRGVHCKCCRVVVPLSVFEDHAGCEPGQPWERILKMSGRSLLECLQEAWDQENVRLFLELQEKHVDEMDPSDDACGICADGGHLICCDSCPSTFHQKCLNLEALPEGSWNCPYCQCMFCMAADDGLHRGTMILDMSTCQQCKHKYHKSCCSHPLENRGFEISSYCSDNCKKMAAQLLDMVGAMNCIEDGLSWVLLKIQKEKAVNSKENQSVVLECNLKLSIALSVLNNCFLPLRDRRTGIDMLQQAIYSQGSKFKRLNYEGFYTMVLQKDEEIISAAMLRFHGKKLAEMPFVGTLPAYQGQRMCRRLLKAVDQVLASLQVEKLVIPAIPDLVETWKRSFSFRPLEPQHKEEIKNLCLVVFAETTLLQKPISSPQSEAQQGFLPASEPKYTSAPSCNGLVTQLTEEEVAVLEMEPFCSFMALLDEDVTPLHR